VFDLDREVYPYLEDVNEGILRHFTPAAGSPERAR
jgi:hypothetical protein